MIGQKGLPAIHGGVERHVEELAKRLVSFGHEITVYSRSWYTGKKEHTIYAEGIHNRYLPTLNSKHLDAITHTFLSTLDAMARGTEIIHYHGVGPSLWSWLPRIFSPMTMVVTTFHCIDRKHEKWNALAKLVLKLGEWTTCRFAHKTITVSRTLEQYTRDVYDTNTVYIPNGATIMADTAQSEAMLKHFGLEPKHYLVVVSRLIPHKGVHTIIGAYNALRDRSGDVTKKFPLVIVGDGHYTEEYSQALRALAKDNPRILFVGYQHGPMLSTLMRHAAVLIHASQAEGLPLTILEAFALRLPVILSDIPEHRELGVSPEWLFPPADENLLSAKIEWFLKLPQEKKLQLSEENYRRAQKNYNWDTIALSTHTLYQSLTPYHNPGAAPNTTISSR